MSLPLFTPPRSLPPGFEPLPDWRWQMVTAPDGARLRVGHHPLPEARARVLVLPGFSEFAEKYWEIARWLISLQLEPWTLDWRGQGGSTRSPFNPEALQITGFERHIADLRHVLAETVPSTLPRGLLAHSMGGHLALRFVCEHPGVVARAVLSAPMLGVPTGAFPLPVARGIAEAHVLAGLGARFVWGFGPWRDRPARREATSRDETLRRVHTEWFAANPVLRIGGPAWSWLASALASCAVLARPAMLRQAQVPLLIGSAGDERFVSPAAITHACAYLGTAQHRHYPEARHELFLELPAVREAWRQEVAGFLAAL
ncbi:MAG: alpha/beta hydrolase [Alphaproteobacteria bacterium]|nr:alpha/beta hydrolase [Alphaproteobacteria bacterium]TAD88173.1 MAG: alpha/beta hydrolase [Alphaproteobacteria bacterium]